MGANRWDNRPKATESKPVASAELEVSTPAVDSVVESETQESAIEKEYEIARGCQLVTARGVLQGGDWVSVSDFSDGQTQFNAHVETGFLVEQR